MKRMNFARDVRRIMKMEDKGTDWHAQVFSAQELRHYLRKYWLAGYKLGMEEGVEDALKEALLE
jgi:hypothetical protein